jgi:hypothetical protein
MHCTVQDRLIAGGSMRTITIEAVLGKWEKQDAEVGAFLGMDGEKEQQ